MSDIEQDIAAIATHPRITLADIEANIVSEHYFTAADGIVGVGGVLPISTEKHPLEMLTFCVLVLKNGYTATAASSCAHPGNFDAEIGRKLAREYAINTIWPLMGYELKSKLAVN